jgi:TolB-like protein
VIFDYAASVAQVAANVCVDTTAEGDAFLATSIAVLPFANVSGDPQLGYFAPGVTNVFAGPLPTT